MACLGEKPCGRWDREAEEAAIYGGGVFGRHGITEIGAEVGTAMVRSYSSRTWAQGRRRPNGWAWDVNGRREERPRAWHLAWPAKLAAVVRCARE